MRRLVLIVLTATFFVTGCARVTSEDPPIQVWPDMKNQPKFKGQAESSFFADGRSGRRPVPGTVAIGHLKEDEGFYTGAKDGMYLGKNPLPINQELLTRGQERFDIYCAPCHDRTGSGRGLVGQKSMWLANSIHDGRAKEMVDGEIFQVISYGRRSMPSYRFQIPERDRWAIVAYVRALQRATEGTVADVPADLRGELR